MQGAGQARLAAAGVTAREAEVLAAIGQRLSNREIADRMVISVRTVESHVSALLRKLGLPDRPALIGLAQRLPGERALPMPATSFVGRDDDVAEVGSVLAGSPLVCLTGPAGCGKTRLALEAARRWHGEARLAELSSATAGDLHARIARVLGGGHEASDLVAAARVALAGTEVLLVADGCEHLTGAAGAVLGSLIRSIPGLRVLATSRTPLGVDGEHVVAVRPLGLPAGTGPEDVRACAAGRLFLDRALAASPQFRLDEASAPHVAAICVRLDGLPLAIEVAAARVRGLGVMELAEGLRDRLEVLERPAPSHGRSLSSAIAWSWQLLDEAERNLLRRLAVLPGEFTLALVAALGPGPAAADPRHVLMRLVEQSLVSMRVPAGGQARYRLLGIIRAFVLRQGGPAADDQVLEVHARFFCGAAEDAVRARYHPSSAATGPADADEPNLLAALAWSAGHDPALAHRLLVPVCQLAETEPSRHALELIRDVATRSPPDWNSEALAWAGLVLMYLSLEDAERLARRSGRAAVSDRDAALADWASGWIHATRGEEAPALRRLDKAIQYARSASDPWLEGLAWQARGVARAGRKEAFADWEQAVVRFVIAGDMLHANNVRFMLAARAVDTHTRLDEVPVWLDECESYASSHGLAHEHAHARLTRARYQRIRGDAGQARRLLDAVLPVFRQAGDFRCIAKTLFETAQPGITDDPAVATGLLLQCLHATVLTRGPAMRAQVLASLITTAAAAGNLVLAARCAGALATLGEGGERAHDDGTTPVPASPDDPVLQRLVREPAYATFVSEGRAGGVELITTIYPR